ncbi:MAG: LPXTG cell wall anchor domain-containing protein, partial [Pseudobutyrivibrio sp.]|nr:LPXTG cell wall anchor domain-containing protein [Pseudobutyrivibrio sp.]
MKGRGKRLATLITLVMLVLSSVMVVSADSNTTLIQRSTSVSNQALDHTKVSVAADTTDTASFSLTVKRADDSFDIYNLVNITPVKTTGNITSLTITWETPVAQFISRHDVFSKDATYMSPETLGAYTVDQTLSEEARAEAEAAAKAETEKKLIDLVKAMKEEYDSATDKAATTIGQLNKVASLSANTVYSNSTINYAKLGSGDNLNSIGDVVIKGDGVTTSEETEESSWNFTYDISNIPFGLYFINASNPIRSAAGGYQPVVVDLIPEQTGPSGNWYIDNTKTATLKNEGIGIDKTINDGKYDIVRQGELVGFDVVLDVPLYNKTNGKFDFTKFNAIDDMSQGFTLIATSATLKYQDAAGNIFHPIATMNGDGYGNKIVNDSNGTYTAKLIGYSYPVYYSDDETQKAYFYVSEVSSGNITVWTNNNGELTSYPMSKNKTNGTYVFSVNELNAINDNLGTDRKIPSTYMTASNASKFVLAENTKSLISVNFNYEKLMSESVYEDTTQSQGDQTQAAAFTIPNKIIIHYETLVNDTFHLGTDDNTNIVKLYYIEDSTGTVGTSESEVVAWTYGANIVKVDGETYDDYLALSAEEKATATSPYLEGAVFDMYRYDITYCGGATNNNQSVEPAQGSYSSFYFYDDVDYPQVDESEANLQTRYANAKTSYVMDTFFNAFKYEFTQKRGITDAQVIGAELQPAATNFPNYLTADTFTNKYNFSALYESGNMKDIHDNYNGNILLDYISPKVKTDNVNGLSYDKDSDFEEGFVQYVPRWVDSCAAHNGGHWHLDAYALYWADTVSEATDTGVTLTGLDPNKYLLVEKTPPAGGYNKLNTAIYFEVNPISNETYIERNNSYAGFLSDEYVDDEGNSVIDDNSDGIYHFVVKNFTGLTLPSTGGMGTLLFTLIGIIVMATVITFVIGRNRKLKKSTASFMAIALMVASLFSGSFIKADAATTISLGQTGAGTA